MTLLFSFIYFKIPSKNVSIILQIISTNIIYDELSIREGKNKIRILWKTVPIYSKFFEIAKYNKNN